MNGQNVLAWVKLALMIAAIAIFGYVVYKFGKTLREKIDGFTSGIFGRDESAGTAAYSVVAAITSPFRSTSPDDINYSGPVTPEEIAMVNRAKPNGTPEILFGPGWADTSPVWYGAP